MVDLWYGRAAADIPIERIYNFVKQKLLIITVAKRKELASLRVENMKMKKFLEPIIKAKKIECQIRALCPKAAKDFAY